jgi:hypothetical protein
LVNVSVHSRADRHGLCEVIIGPLEDIEAKYNAFSMPPFAVYSYSCHMALVSSFNILIEAFSLGCCDEIHAKVWWEYSVKSPVLIMENVESWTTSTDLSSLA